MSDARPAATPYPPEQHALRDLDVTTEQVTGRRALSLAPVGEGVRNRAGAASLGFLAALVDLTAARVALFAAQPDWTATVDLSLHATGWLTTGPAVVDGRLVRAGANLVVVAVDVYDGRGITGLDDLGDLAELRDDAGDRPLDTLQRPRA